MPSVFGYPPGAMPRWRYWFRRHRAAFTIIGAFALGAVCAGLAIKMPAGWFDRLTNPTAPQRVTAKHEPVVGGTIRVIAADRVPPLHATATTGRDPASGTAVPAAAQDSVGARPRRIAAELETLTLWPERPEKPTGLAGIPANDRGASATEQAQETEQPQEAKQKPLSRKRKVAHHSGKRMKQVKRRLREQRREPYQREDPYGYAMDGGYRLSLYPRSADDRYPAYRGYSRWW